MKPIVIFDLDGTLALIDHRKHLVEKSVSFRMWLDSLEPERHRELSVQLPPERIMEVFMEEQKWAPKWDEFFEQCHNDSPNIPVVEIYRLIHAHQEVHVFSGRSIAVKDKTIAWFDKHGIPLPHVLRMRPDKDFTPDEELKSKWADHTLGGRYVQCVFDDRDKVVRMWRRRGIACFQVAYGNF